MTRIFALCAGEASGDQLGAGLMREIRARDPQAVFVGIGGPHMREQGLDAWFDASELAVMGLVEVLRHLPRLLRLRRQFMAKLVQAQPCIYIGIDAPDFNLGVERRLRAHGIHSIHYVSPSIWAWRQKRAAKIGQSADLVLCLFPFEPDLYARYGVDARFVGHPFADEIPLEIDKAQARAILDLPADGRVLALLPGSRFGEIARLASDFLKTGARLQLADPDLTLLLSVANPAIGERLSSLLAEVQSAQIQPLRVVLVNQDVRTAIAACDVALVASGTATLEVALIKRPMVVAYRIAALTYWIVKTFRLLKVSHYSLPNVLAKRAIVPEISQDDITPERLSRELSRWFTDKAAVDQLEIKFDLIHRQLRRDASARAAEAVLESVS